MRFNDMRVSDVVEEEVVRESIGGHANSSAYFLIYVEKSMLGQVCWLFRIHYSYYLSILIVRYFDFFNLNY